MTPSTDYTGPTAAEAEARARAMTHLSPTVRNMLIALGIIQRVVIDARHRFDADHVTVGPIVTETVFEGVFGPGDCA